MQPLYNNPVREAVGVFEDYDELYETIKELGTVGFGRHQISVLGSDEAVEEIFQRPEVTPEVVEDNPFAPRSFNVGLEELGVAQGVLIGSGIYVGAIVGILSTGGLAEPGSLMTLALTVIAGGMVGGLLALVLGDQYHQFFRKREANGGLVLWVETPTQQTEQTAQKILRKHGAHDIHIHEMPLAA